MLTLKGHRLLRQAQEAAQQYKDRKRKFNKQFNRLKNNKIMNFRKKTR